MIAGLPIFLVILIIPTAIIKGIYLVFEFERVDAGVSRCGEGCGTNRGCTLASSLSLSISREVKAPMRSPVGALDFAILKGCLKGPAAAEGRSRICGILRSDAKSAILVSGMTRLSATKGAGVLDFCVTECILHPSMSFYLMPQDEVRDASDRSA